MDIREKKLRLAFEKFQLNKFQEVIEICNEISHQDENVIKVLNLKSISYFKLGKINHAINTLVRAELFSDNRDISLLSNRANFYLLNKNFQNSLSDYQKCLHFQPNNDEIINSIGIVHGKIGDHDKAIHFFSKAININSKKNHFFYNRGNSKFNNKLFYESLADFNYSIKLNPKHLNSYYSRGVVFEEISDFNNALKDFNFVINNDNRHYRALLAKGYLLIRKKEFREGFFLHEYRWKFLNKNEILNLPDNKLLKINNNIDHKIILVHYEQGIGDTIQFSRFLKELKKKNCKIIFYVQKFLKNLMSTLDKDIEVIDTFSNKVNYDYHIPLMSLPNYLKTNYENIYYSTPYISIDIEKINYWKNKFKSYNKHKKIALAWGGNPNQKNDYKRSILFSDIYDLLDEKYIWISLQNNLLENEKINFQKSNLINLAQFQENFDDVAHIVSLCDIIITVDTSFCHLAGALGKKVYLLLPEVADFRWFENESTTHWYPTVNLIRKQKNISWRTTVKKLLSEISI